MEQLTIQQALELALKAHHAGRLADAERGYRVILQREPSHWEATLNLGVLARQVGRNDVAMELFVAAVKARPGMAQGHLNLGNVLFDLKRLDEAVAAYREAVRLGPGMAIAHHNLGIALKEKGLLVEAIESLRKAIAIKPDYAEAFNNLANAYRENQQLDEAMEAYRKAIGFRSGYAEAYCNLATVLKDVGRIDEAIDAGRRAIAVKPGYVEAHSNLICAMNYLAVDDGKETAAELGRWNRAHGEELGKNILPHGNDRDPERKLRIGYVSADFRNHASVFFLMPLYEHHDRGQVEIFSYAEVRQPNAKTAIFQKLSDGWRSTVGASDEAVAEQIRADGIDILVDLKVHTAENRLKVFARKPAPMQVTWLGYPGSTGLRTVDYRLSDPWLDPLGMDESVYTEKTIRLPETFWCYDPLEENAPAVNELPAVENGYVTFGCLNNFSKVNDGLLKVWAKVMREVEGSRLMLLPVGRHREKLLAKMKGMGIEEERVEFSTYRARPEYLELYRRVDVGLDPFPCNGHTTSLDSFWMGVPVVTLVGKTAMSRAGWSELSNLGLGELAGKTAEEYVKIAVELARDLPRLGELRRTLRGRMEQSALMDGERFARNVEKVYREIWRIRCARES